MNFTTSFFVGWRGSFQVSRRWRARSSRLSRAWKRGQTFVLQCALGNDIAGSRKTTPVSRAWRKSANWLDDLLHGKKVADAEITRRRILRDTHLSPAQATATPQQITSFTAFEAWKANITAEMLQHDVWVAAFKQVAVKHAEKEERTAQYASLTKWMKWIHEGPASGLRRQHRFNRTADGWAPHGEKHRQGGKH